VPIALTLDKFLCALGDTVTLTASFTAPPGTSEVLVSIGVIRPDGNIEYPVYMQRLTPPPPAAGAAPSAFQSTVTTAYKSKMMGFHKAFAQFYAYQNSQQIGNELTPLDLFGAKWLFVGPSLALILPSAGS